MVRWFSRLATLAALALAAAPLAAQTWPAKPVRMVIAFPPGGSTDLLARALAQKMQENIGESFVVDNRPGGGGLIAADAVAKAAADGYTWLLTVDHVMTMDPAMRPKMPFSPERDFAPIGSVASQNLILVTNPKSPFRTFRELVAHARANPGKLTYGSSVLYANLVAEKMKADLGASMVHVPFRGAPQMVPAILNGEVDLVIVGVLPYANYARDGKMRVLASTGPRREVQLPDVPTLAEEGHPDLSITSWFWMFAPAGTPAAILDRANAEIGRALADGPLRERLISSSLIPATSTRAELAALMRAESDRWGKVIRAAGMKAE